MNRFFIAVLALGALLLLSSCFEYEEDITVHADGSGGFKMKVGLSGMLAGMMEMGGSADNPFKEMETEAARITEEGDPDGIVTGASFETSENSDKSMKYFTFSIAVSDMTRIAEAVEAEWWRGAPGVEDKGDEIEPPFKIEKHGESFVFSKEIVVPAQDGTIPGRDETESGHEDSGYGFDPEILTPPGGDELGGEGGNSIDGHETGSLGLLDKAVAAILPASPANADEKDVKIETHSPKSYEPEDWKDAYAEGIELTQEEENPAESPDMPDMLEMPELPELDEQAMQDMAMQMFTGKYYTIRLTVPELIETNGHIAGEDLHGDAGHGGGPVTVEWIIPMSDLMTGNGYYRQLSAEFTLGGGDASGAGGIVRGIDVSMLIVAAAGIIVLLFVGLLAISVKSPVPAKSGGDEKNPH